MRTAAPSLGPYLTEIGSIDSGLYKERLAFADAVLMDRLLVSCPVGHLQKRARGQEQVGELQGIAGGSFDPLGTSVTCMGGSATKPAQTRCWPAEDRKRRLRQEG